MNNEPIVTVPISHEVSVSITRKDSNKIGRHLVESNGSACKGVSYGEDRNWDNFESAVSDCMFDALLSICDHKMADVLECLAQLNLTPGSEWLGTNLEKEDEEFIKALTNSAEKYFAAKRLT